MSTLLIMRHGEAEARRRPDFARELTTHGVERTRAAAEALGAEGAPDLVIASPAARALQTAEILIAALTPGSGAPVVDRELYDRTEPEALMRIVRRHAGDARRVALIGHNPGLSWLAGWLCDGASPGLGTSDLVEIDLGDADWNLAGAGDGRLVRHIG